LEFESTERKTKNPIASTAWRLAKTISSQGAPCAVCGSYEDIQMHHVRALKDIAKSTNAIHKYMIAIERKQIPVCREHHLELHRGKWSNKPSKVIYENK
jgi:hypothetical protein